MINPGKKTHMKSTRGAVPAVTIGQSLATAAHTLRAVWNHLCEAKRLADEPGATLAMREPYEVAVLREIDVATDALAELADAEGLPETSLFGAVLTGAFSSLMMAADATAAEDVDGMLRMFRAARVAIENLPALHPVGGIRPESETHRLVALNCTKRCINEHVGTVH